MVKVLRLALCSLMLVTTTARAEPTVTGYELVSTTRSGRTTVDYTYRVRVQSGTAAYQNVQLSVVSLVTSTVILQGHVYVGVVEAGSGRLSADTFTIRQDRTRPFNSNVLKWTVTGQEMTEDAGPVTLLDLRLVEFGGRPEHQGLFEISGEPVLGAGPVLCRAALSGSVEIAQYSLVDESGAVIRTGAFEPVTETEVDRGDFTSTIDLPDSPFRIVVSGRDKQARPFSHVWARLFEPTYLRLDNPAAVLRLRPGDSASVPVRVTNFGPAAAFVIAAVGDIAVLTAPVHEAVTLDTNQEREVHVGISIPPDAFDQTAYQVGLAAAPEVTPEKLTAAVIQIRVER
jgi:hypothetical protein